MDYRLGNPYTLFLLFTGLFSLALAVYVSRYRARRGVRPLVALFVGATIWSISDALRIAAPTESAILLWNKVGYFGVAVMPVGVVLFAAAYTDRETWLRPTRIAVLASVSVVMYATVLTNPYHGLWRTAETASPGTAPPVLVAEFGAVHLVWDAYVLLFATPLALAWIVQAHRTEHPSGLVRRQTAVVLGAFLVPYVSSTLYVTGVVSVDPTPFGFLLTGAGLTAAVLRYQLLDVVPIARERVLEYVESGVLVLDRDDVVVDANQRALSLLGTDEAALVGTPVTGVTAGLPVDAERFVDVRETSETIAVEDGDETVHYDVTITPIDSAGEYLGRVVIFSDVTDRVRRQAELTERTAALERRNERLDEFASLVSHDLRNPLNVVASSVELAQARDDPSELDRAESALRRMDDIIDDLLVLSRSGSGIDGTTPVDLASVAERAWGNLEGEGGRLRVRDDAPTVDGDPSQLDHLFANLFRNAVEHNDGPVTVTVGPLDDGDASGFFVADDGAGIPADDHDVVLEHGYTTGEAGTGFGLSIVKHIADAHGWELAVGAAADGGARFEFRTG